MYGIGMASHDIEAAVGEVLGSSGDPTVLEYITSCLEDFDLGDGGKEAYESFGPMMVCRLPSNMRSSMSTPILSMPGNLTAPARLRRSTSACLYA